ncbi:YerC/YecD family TrpR-related protein [uncultured Clostridium sp.]|jgi:TrpR-related protein YerC/YecD|uniref:YerC/YecD family TrpR-related protein n=1 Tax=Clostridium sp. TaxID=1506 RepID=UPI0025F3772D|nr:YerC/YecD family TrpR-related protein [uncultured Clostridium sp.]
MGLKELEFKNDLDMLFQAILELENIDECYKFFEDIATITELKSISQRIQVAKMLREKRVYTEIAETTGASTATISRVNKCLNYGQGGYDIVLDRINSKDK